MSSEPKVMTPVSLGKRRNLFIAILAVFVIILILYSQPVVDTDRFKNIIPGHGSSDPDPAAKGTDIVDDGDSAKVEVDVEGQDGDDGDQDHQQTGDDDGKDAEHDDDEGDAKDESEDEEVIPTSTFVKTTKPTAAPSAKPSSSGWSFFGGSSNEKVSHFHFLIPASDPNLHLCYNLISAAANRYPVPVLAGWKGEGEFNAAKTHLAKLRSIQRYLDGLPKEDDDDLITIVDGYDIIMQLPPDIMIERYFEMRDRADERLAKRFGINVGEARKKGLRQTIFWGPDKICWPIDGNAPRCWAVPHTSFPQNAFGPKSGNGEMLYADPRWLNSGTVIGPIKDFRNLIHDTMKEIELTYDDELSYSESDQYYISNVWGRQEYFRSKKAAAGGAIPHSDGKDIPELREGQKEDQTELHVSIDYESTLFQTKAGYEPFFGYLHYNQSGFKASQTRDMFGLGEAFRPAKIQMPANVLSSLTKLYNSVPDAHPDVSAQDWIANVPLGTNFISKTIYALWHCTGPKQWIDGEYHKLWFRPFADALMKSSIKASHDKEPISSQLIDGRKWVPKTVYPDADTLQDELGGAWSDQNGPKWLNFERLCGKHYDKLFGELPDDVDWEFYG